MTANFFSLLWTAGLREICNHLWQSTLFAALVWILTLTLHRYQARTRYWLWMAASVKLLIPFSLLALAVSHLQWIIRAGESQTAAFDTIHRMGRPFTDVTGFSTSITSLTAPLAASHYPIEPLMLLLTAVWLLGFIAVLAFWLMQWRRVAKAVHITEPLRSGREVVALRRVERIAGLSRPMEIVPSEDSMEPGVFGALCPVLLWPDGISRHLDDAHLEAILAHEVCHVRRHDNLTSMVHMLVVATFWFHLPVWWMKKQLIKERELACDEEVVDLCHQPQVYAESILKVCEYCIESPLPCVSGITGADLKKRVMQIMTGRIRLKLSRGGKLLVLAAVMVAASAGVVMLGVRPSAAQIPEATAPKYQGVAIQRPLPASFEVATVKVSPPDHGATSVSPPGATTFLATNAPLKILIELAYGVDANKIAGKPEWFGANTYDIVAKVEGGAGLNYQQLQVPLQHLLAERFHLVSHHETREMNGYALVVARGGPKFETSKGGDATPIMVRNELKMHNMSMSMFAMMLGKPAERPVVDKTGLAGNYDLDVKFAPLNATDSQMPPIFTALQEQLGLKLEAEKVPVDVLVIDSVDTVPTEN